MEQNAGCSCKNGKCVVNEKGKEVCECPPEFGYYTSTICKACECGKGSNCTFSGLWTTTKTCICKKGYKAEKDICKGPCTPDPCKNGGNCTDIPNSYKCVCPPKYMGKNCEKINT
ncbi:delta-like protein 1, partial [Stegodyphus dumicola]|uniref:delta-like protein 1 n=1 Tax=Stegodyphus dumicola TaxID=202533 RepID=UPI0015AADF88